MKLIDEELHIRFVGLRQGDRGRGCLVDDSGGANGIRYGNQPGLKIACVRLGDVLVLAGYDAGALPEVLVPVLAVLDEAFAHVVAFADIELQCVRILGIGSREEIDAGSVEFQAPSEKRAGRCAIRRARFPSSS